MGALTYVVTHRLAGKRRTQQRADSAEACELHVSRLLAHGNVQASPSTPASGVPRQVVRLSADPEWIRDQHAHAHADVVVEPQVEFWPHSGFIAADRHLAQHAALEEYDRHIQVTVKGGGPPLSGAQVTLLYKNLEGQQRLLPPESTDENGRLDLRYHSSCKPLVLGVYPTSGYWTVCRADPTDVEEVVCQPLPSSGPLGWWHHAMGIDRHDPDAGRGIRVGLIGTGATPHPCLPQLVRADGKDDVSAHGTHVCGIVGARPLEPGQFAGIAPGAGIVSRRVFEMVDGSLVPADQGHLAQAIDAMAVDGVDLINMSLGGTHSMGLHDAVMAAMEHGTICVCSAGNSSGAVEYPAALKETVGTSGLGQRGWGPSDSSAAYMMPDPASQADHFGKDGLYLAKYSCHGPQIACAAPGSGIISTVPPHANAAAPFAAMDGTSMAAPAVCARLAGRLAASPDYLALPRDGRRADRALAEILMLCADIGLQADFQGAGLPSQS